VIAARQRGKHARHHGPEAGISAICPDRVRQAWFLEMHLLVESKAAVVFRTKADEIAALPSIASAPENCSAHWLVERLENFW
jgi:hypothetical protein